MSRRAESLDLGQLRLGFGLVHLPVDSTGLKLHGSGEWLLEKHGTKIRRWWRKLHIAVDGDTGRIAAASLTTSEVDDASQVAACHPKASIIVPPRSTRLRKFGFRIE